jgi:hypothetical protein
MFKHQKPTAEAARSQDSLANRLRSLDQGRLLLRVDQ